MVKPCSRSDHKAHVDRKFEKKVQFYDLVKSSVAQKTITKEKQKRKRSRQKKLKAYDLSALSDFLPELKAPLESKPAELKLNSKSKNKLVLKESNKLKTVIDHPDFQSDPLGAIYQYLQSTQPITDEKLIKKGKRKPKKKKTNASSQQSMEF